MKIKLILTLFFVTVFVDGFSQTTDTIVPKQQYLSFQPSFTLDGFNSFGVRIFLEYTKDLKNNWQWGLSYDHTTPLFDAATATRTLEANYSNLSLNGYYKLNVFKDRVFYTGGLGIGVTHFSWTRFGSSSAHAFTPTINASLSLGIRVSKRIIIETSPLLVLLPSNRVYYSPVNVEEFPDFYSFTIFPLGIKVKL